MLINDRFWQIVLQNDFAPLSAQDRFKIAGHPVQAMDKRFLREIYSTYLGADRPRQDCW
jgi:hypothetical protein